MYIHYRGLKLLNISGRLDEDNAKILNGDYLDKTPAYKYPDGYDDNVDSNFLQPEEIPFTMPSQDEMMKYIFSDWQKGDILIISDSPLKHPKLQGDTLVEMTREEICSTGNLSILLPGEIFEEGIIKTIPRIDGIKVEWQYPNWIEIATLEEQLEYYKQEILKANRELLVYEKAGFTNQELQIKLNELIKKHNEISFDIASEENKFF